MFALNYCGYGWPGATTLLAHDSKTGFESACIKPRTRNLWLERHSALPPRRAFEPYPHRNHLLMPPKREVVAVIDDDLGIRGAISRLLSALGYAPGLYASANEFLGVAKNQDVHSMCGLC